MSLLDQKEELPMTNNVSISITFTIETKRGGFLASAFFNYQISIGSLCVEKRNSDDEELAGWRPG